MPKKFIDVAKSISMMSLLFFTSAFSTPECQAKQGITGFSDFGATASQSNQINYQIDSASARFFTFIPDNYNSSTNFGLIVYTSPDDTVTGLPQGWGDVLTRRKFLFVAAQGAGNNSNFGKRLGLGVKGAMGMMRQYKIDPNRVYAAGLSGGARNANDLAFYQGDLFHGTIQDCGCNYFRAVKKVAATSDKDTLGNPYGLSQFSQNEIARARSGVRFGIITGSDDFRRGNILDIYNDGFARDGFQARLFDIKGMGHQDCSSETLEKVLSYLDTGR